MNSKSLVNTTNTNVFIVCPQPGYTVDLSKLVDAGRLLLEMGYAVRRIKIKRDGQKTLLNAIEIKEAEPDDTADDNG